jgi:hypothetical protein
MAQSMFDADALISAFESATAQQSQQLRKAVTDATMAALQGRELTLKNVRAALKAVSDAAGTGAAKNPMADVDVESLLDVAVAGMDDALLKAVDAHRVALQQLAAQGADLRAKHLKKAIEDLDRFEDTMIESIRKSAGGAGEQIAAAWGPVLDKLSVGGTMSGAQAASAAEQFTQQMQGAMRDSRNAGLRAAQALAESYGALVSGVLIGMADAMRQAPAAKAPARRK